MNGSSNPHQHIPAWKRLGLKLKYAKDFDEVYPCHESTSAGTIAASEESLDGDDATRFNENVSSSTKRRKLNVRTANPTTSHLNGRISVTPESFAEISKQEPGAVASVESALVESHEVDVPKIHHSSTSSDLDPDIRSNKPEERRKSVTFTPETKQEDGFSASSLFKHSSLLGSSTVKEDSERAQQPEVTPRKSKRTKKQANDQSDQLSTRDSQRNRSETAIPEFVRYLQLFHSDRESWKFNKKKQTDLLKNLFDTSRVGPEMDEAVFQYIDGLQGISARQKLIETATTVLKEIAEKDSGVDIVSGMESEEARRNAYIDALHRQVARREGLGLPASDFNNDGENHDQRNVENGQRAEAVLQQLLENELYPERAKAPAQTSVSKTHDETHKPFQKPDTSSKSASTAGRKRRKVRTHASSPSSDSDGDDSPSHPIPKRPNAKDPTTVHEALSSRVPLPPPERRPETAKPTGKKVVFDDDFLNDKFGPKKTYHETAPKRKAEKKKTKPRGYAYTMGNRADESGSDDEN